jgi:hypothetical protein
MIPVEFVKDFFFRIPMKIPWGTVFYLSLVGFVLYSIFPSGNKETGGPAEIAVSLLAALAIIIAIAVIGFLVYLFFSNRAKKKRVEEEKKKTESGKDKGKETLKEVPKAPPSLLCLNTFLCILVAIILLPTLFHMVFISTDFAQFGDHIITPPEGKIYFPLWGMTVAGYIVLLYALHLNSSSVIMQVNGFFIGLGLWLWGILDKWFMPFSHAHKVTIPILRFIGLGDWILPPDPVIWKFWVYIGLIVLLIIPAISRKIPTMESQYAVLAVFIGVFVQQMAFIN